MRKSTPLVLLTAALAGSPPAFAAPAPVAYDWFEYTGRDQLYEVAPPPGHYVNPILAGFYPDPSICRVGDDFYLVNSTFVYFPGIPVFHSRDLVHWTQIGNVIDRPAQVRFDGLGVSRGVFAPAISHHHGTYYVLNTLVDAGGNCLFTATNPAGPWSDPVFLDFEGIDPSFFFDDDGRAWLVNNGAPVGPPLYQGHRAIWLQEFDLAAKKTIGPRQMILNGGVDITQKPVWIEGPHIFKKDGWYYLCCAEGGTSIQHSQVILRSRSVTGPYVPWEKNPILTQRDLDSTAPHAVTCTGHAELVPGPDGRWWSVFLGCRPFDGEHWTTGRETFLLPVEWTADGWPVILPPGGRVPLTPPAPRVAAPDAAPVPLSGNFTWRDEFDGPALSSPWLMYHQPDKPWWSFAQGRLNLAPHPDQLQDKGHPSFLGRRVQHARFTASTSFTVPAGPEVSAGLAVFQSETQHYFFGVRRDGGGLLLFVEEANGGAPKTVASTVIPAVAQLALRLTCDDAVLAFAYAAKPGEWQTLLPDADALAVSVQAAGGGLHFTGAVVGPYARLEP